MNTYNQEHNVIKDTVFSGGLLAIGISWFILAAVQGAPAPAGGQGIQDFATASAATPSAASGALAVSPPAAAVARRAQRA